MIFNSPGDGTAKELQSADLRLQLEIARAARIQGDVPEELGLKAVADSSPEPVSGSGFQLTESSQVYSENKPFMDRGPSRGMSQDQGPPRSMMQDQRPPPGRQPGLDQQRSLRPSDKAPRGVETSPERRQMSSGGQQLVAPPPVSSSPRQEDASPPQRTTPSDRANVVEEEMPTQASSQPRPGQTSDSTGPVERRIQQSSSSSGLARQQSNLDSRSSQTSTYFDEILDSRPRTSVRWYFCKLLKNIAITGFVIPIIDIAFFSGIGYGPSIYVRLDSMKGLKNPCAFLAFLIFFTLYMTDFFRPIDGRKPMSSTIGRCGLVFGIFLTCLGALVSVDTYPSAPLVASLLGGPFVVLIQEARFRRKSLADLSDEGAEDEETENDEEAIKRASTRALIRRNERMRHDLVDSFETSMAAALIFNGFWCLMAWLFWQSPGGSGRLKGEHRWNNATRVEFEDRGITEEKFGKNTLTVSYLIWVAPGIAAVVCVSLAGLLLFNVHLHKKLRNGVKTPGGRRSTGPGSDSDGGDKYDADERHRIKTLVHLIKMISLMFFSLGGVIWVGAAVAGAQLKIASVVVTFLFCSAGGMCIFVYMSLSPKDVGLLKKGIKSNPFMKTGHDFVYNSNWSKAMFVGMILPLYPNYMVLSAMNQSVRRMRGILPEEDREFCFTAKCRSHIAAMKKWPWTEVLANLHRLCLIIVVLQVLSGIGTNVLLAFINAKLAGTSFVTLCLLFLIIGISMFLIPVVPGIPVYLFGGIMIVAGFVPKKTDPETGDLVPAVEDPSFWMGYVIAVCLNFSLKFMAITIQQKGIGEPLSNNRSILQTVGVNTPTMKAIELILKHPGFSFGKVTILCGGPDWPTSVLTGILRLSLFKMLLGSIPVIINVCLVTAAGAFKLRETLGEQWEAMSSTVLSVAAGWNILQMVVATYYIQDTWEKHHTMLAKPRKDHLELDWLDYISARQKEEYDRQTQWNVLPACIKRMLIIGACWMVFSTFLMLMMSSSCWGTFEVTDPISRFGLHFIEPTGWFALFLHGLGCVVLWIFEKWSDQRTKKARKKIAEDLQPMKALKIKEWSALAAEESATHTMSEQELGLVVSKLQDEVVEWKKRATREQNARDRMTKQFQREMDKLKQRLESVEKASAKEAATPLLQKQPSSGGGTTQASVPAPAPPLPPPSRQMQQQPQQPQQFSYSAPGPTQAPISSQPMQQQSRQQLQQQQQQVQQLQQQFQRQQQQAQARIQQEEV